MKKIGFVLPDVIQMQRISRVLMNDALMKVAKKLLHPFDVVQQSYLSNDAQFFRHNPESLFFQVRNRFSCVIILTKYS